MICDLQQIKLASEHIAGRRNGLWPTPWTINANDINKHSLEIRQPPSLMRLRIDLGVLPATVYLYSIQIHILSKRKRKHGRRLKTEM
jgi:hypothetical protein